MEWGLKLALFPTRKTTFIVKLSHSGSCCIYFQHLRRRNFVCAKLLALPDILMKLFNRIKCNTIVRAFCEKVKTSAQEAGLPAAVQKKEPELQLRLLGRNMIGPEKGVEIKSF